MKLITIAAESQFFGLRTLFSALVFIYCIPINAQVSRVDAEKEESEWKQPKQYEAGIKIDFLNIINGRLGLSYERLLASQVALDIEVNYLLPYYRGSLASLTTIPEGFNGIENGFSIRIMPKFLWLKSTIGDASWYGVSYELAFERYSIDVTHRHILAAHLGTERSLFKSERLYFSFSMGFGLFYLTYPQPAETYGVGFVIPFKLALGYLI